LNRWHRDPWVTLTCQHMEGLVWGHVKSLNVTGHLVLSKLSSEDQASLTDWPSWHTIGVTQIYRHRLKQAVPERTLTFCSSSQLLMISKTFIAFTVLSRNRLLGVANGRNPVVFWSLLEDYLILANLKAQLIRKKKI